MFKLTPNETKILSIHRHPIVLLFELTPFIFLLFLPLILFGGFLYMGGTIDLGPVGNAVAITLTSLYFCYIWVFILYAYFDFILDIWTVTDERIINVEQKGLFIREASEQELNKIQDVTAVVKGFWPTIFGYGDVYLQTAGTEEHFIFKQVEHPYEIVETITKTLDSYKEKHRPL